MAAGKSIFMTCLSGTEFYTSKSGTALAESTEARLGASASMRNKVAE